MKSASTSRWAAVFFFIKRLPFQLAEASGGAHNENAEVRTIFRRHISTAHLSISLVILCRD